MPSIGEGTDKKWNGPIMPWMELFHLLGITHTIRHLQYLLAVYLVISCNHENEHVNGKMLTGNLFIVSTEAQNRLSKVQKKWVLWNRHWIWIAYTHLQCLLYVHWITNVLVLHSEKCKMNGNGNSIITPNFIWEWGTPQSKLRMEFPFPNAIFILRV